jgi:hypothetical protein
MFWYPAHRARVLEILKSDWGRLFHHWEDLAIDPNDLDAKGWAHIPEAPAELRRESLKYLTESFRILGTCLREAPEFAARRRRRADAR